MDNLKICGLGNGRICNKTCKLYEEDGICVITHIFKELQNISNTLNDIRKRG